MTSSGTATNGDTSYTVNQVIGTTPDVPAGHQHAGRQLGSPSPSRTSTPPNGWSCSGRRPPPSCSAGRASAVGQTIKLGAVDFVVLGVLASKDSTGFTDPNATAIVPISTLRATQAGYGALNQIVVQAADKDRVDTAQAEVTQLLDRTAPGAGQPDLAVPDHQLGADPADQPGHRRDLHRAAGDGGRDQPARRRHRRHQHHAGHRHRADPRDRHPQGARRAAARRSSASS